MKKTMSMTLEELRSVKIPVTIDGAKTFIRSLEPFGVGDGMFAMTVYNDEQCSCNAEIVIPYHRNYNTCARAVNRWIKKELTKRIKESK